MPRELDFRFGSRSRPYADDLRGLEPGGDQLFSGHPILEFVTGRESASLSEIVGLRCDKLVSMVMSVMGGTVRDGGRRTLGALRDDLRYGWSSS